MNVTKIVKDSFSSIKLYSVIYLDENGMRKAKVCNTKISRNFETKKLRLQGLTIIEENDLEKNVEQNNDYNPTEEDIIDVKKDFSGIENAKSVSDVENIIKSRSDE